MSRVDEILTFWFGTPRDDEEYYATWHKLWFMPDPQFDLTVRERFLDDYQFAAERKLMEWQEQPRSGLALILLCDQFPRNMFRNDPRAFATDPLARAVATHLLQMSLDRHLLPVERSFIYMPFMHSEALHDQQHSVTLFRQLAEERAFLNSVPYALRHREIIERFGRFPHRNTSLGRQATPEEEAFLTQPGSSF